MPFKSTKLTGTIILCSIALSACAPIQKRIVKIIPGNSQTSTVVSQEVVQQTQRVVQRSAPQVRTTVRTPRTAPAATPPVRTNTSNVTPVIPVAVEVKPAKKDCSVKGTSGCPVTRSFGDEDSGGGNSGGGGGWSG